MNAVSGLDGGGYGARRIFYVCVTGAWGVSCRGKSGADSEFPAKGAGKAGGAGIGALAGLLIDYLGAGTPALWAGAAAGALIPQFVLGAPGR